MADMIRDGQGKGYLSGVDSENRLKTYSTTESEISHESEVNTQAFVFMAECIPGINSTGVCSIINDSSTKNLIIQYVILSSEENTSATAMTSFGFWRNPTTNSGGVSITPVNLNFSSNNIPDCTCLHDDDGTTLTIDGGNSVGTIRLMGATTQSYNFEGSIILKTNNTFAIKSKTENAGQKVRATIYFYYHNIL